MNKVFFINDLTEWIDENLSDVLTINRIAHRSGYSSWYLQKVFKSVKGETLGSYVRRKKIITAAKELVDDQVSILDVALKYQFDSQQSFSRAFKKQFKITPGKFRKVGHIFLNLQDIKDKL